MRLSASRWLAAHALAQIGLIPTNFGTLLWTAWPNTPLSFVRTLKTSAFFAFLLVFSWALY